MFCVLRRNNTAYTSVTQMRWLSDLYGYYSVVIIDQLDRSLDCGSSGCGFESHWLPQILRYRSAEVQNMKPKCPVCRDGILYRKYDEESYLHYSVCSYCKSEIADADEVHLNKINYQIKNLKNKG